MLAEWVDSVEEHTFLCLLKKQILFSKEKKGLPANSGVKKVMNSQNKQTNKMY